MWQYQNTELCHYGVPGQKWGVIRSIFGRGGRSKASKITKQRLKDSKKIGDRKDDKKEDENDVRKLNPKKLSDADLKAAVTRLQLEADYNRLNPKHVSAGKKFINDYVTKAVVPAINDASKQLLTEAIKKGLTAAVTKAAGAETSKKKK